MAENTAPLATDRVGVAPGLLVEAAMATGEIRVDISPRHLLRAVATRALR